MAHLQQQLSSHFGTGWVRKLPNSLGASKSVTKMPLRQCDMPCASQKIELFNFVRSFILTVFVFLGEVFSQEILTKGTSDSVFIRLSDPDHFYFHSGWAWVRFLWIIHELSKHILRKKICCPESLFDGFVPSDNSWPSNLQSKTTSILCHDFCTHRMKTKCYFWFAL